MEQPKWSKKLKTGHLWQDYQHRRFFEMMKSFEDAVLEFGEQEEFNRMMGFLENYVHDHFGVEEAYMDEFDYPERKKHLQEHKQFIELLGETREKYKAGEKNKPLHLYLDISIWFYEHIQQSDKQLGEFLSKAKK